MSKLVPRYSFVGCGASGGCDSRPVRDDEGNWVNLVDLTPQLDRLERQLTEAAAYSRRVRPALEIVREILGMSDDGERMLREQRREWIAARRREARR